MPIRLGDGSIASVKGDESLSDNNITNYFNQFDLQQYLTENIKCYANDEYKLGIVKERFGEKLEESFNNFLLEKVIEEKGLILQNIPPEEILDEEIYYTKPVSINIKNQTLYTLQYEGISINDCFNYFIYEIICLNLDAKLV